MKNNPQQSVALTDEMLVERILAGEHRLYEQLIRRYNQRLYRLGMSVLGNESAVEEAMQVTYINAWRHLSGFEHRSSLSTWLSRIMLNQCFAEQRNAKRNSQLDTVQFKIITMETPENAFANKELGAILERAISRLPEKYRLVFVLREIEKTPVRETSEVLQIGEQNVKTRLNRAKALLKEDLTLMAADYIYSFHLLKCDRVVNIVMDQIVLDEQIL